MCKHFALDMALWQRVQDGGFTTLTRDRNKRPVHKVCIKDQLTMRREKRSPKNNLQGRRFIWMGVQTATLPEQLYNKDLI